MDTTTKGTTMVNPSQQDEDKFRNVVSIVDKVNDLRAEALKIVYNINDSVLRRNAAMLMGLPDETARKL
jgi:hypothetical protein